jgi:hypothetical protein
MEFIIRQAEQNRNLLDAEIEVVTFNAEVDGAMISIPT